MIPTGEILVESSRADGCDGTLIGWFQGAGMMTKNNRRPSLVILLKGESRGRLRAALRNSVSLDEPGTPVVDWQALRAELRAIAARPSPAALAALGSGRGSAEVTVMSLDDFEAEVTDTVREMLNELGGGPLTCESLERARSAQMLF
jgi:hypothetical protein